MAAAVVAAVLLLAGCDESSPTDAERDYESVQALYDAAGGEQWCGAELVVVLEPSTGRCGDPTEEGSTPVVLGAAYLSREQLLESVGSARDGELLVLTTADTSSDEPWFQLRSADADLLVAAQDAIGGALLSDAEDIEDWLDRNGAPSP